MTASNHFVTGALIGASVASAWVAIPLAIGSHFVLDAMPHYGYEGDKERRRFNISLFQWVLVLDVVMLLILAWMLVFITESPELILFGFAAYSPDLTWLYQFTTMSRLGRKFITPNNKFERFHAGIQRLESPWGLIVEIPLFTMALYAVVILTA